MILPVEKMPVKLDIKNITKSFGEGSKKREVLKDISFTVNKGEFVCILGPSGCGKSTLLRHIAGFETIDSGSILLNGQEPENSMPNRIMVFQDFNQLFPWKTVLENVMFPLEVNKTGISKKQMEQVAGRYLKMVKLEGYDNYYPHQLSGGMKQKAAIARSLVLNPEVLLMDEPFGSLDAQGKSALLEMLLKIWEETGITILFVTHDIQEAIILSDRIIVMDNREGNIKKVIQNGIERPRSPSCMGFAKLWQDIYDLLES